MKYEKNDVLIAVGAAVAANCQTCLQASISRATAGGATEKEIAGAMEIGKLIRQGAANKMDAFAASGNHGSADELTAACGEEQPKEKLNAKGECSYLNGIWNVFNGYTVWWFLLVWWGITLAVAALPEGAGLAGSGVILLGLNLVRILRGVSINCLSTILGFIALTVGGWEIARSMLNLEFSLPVLPFAMIVLGLFFLGRQLFPSAATSGHCDGKD